jgi:hypothetical protein
MSHGRRLPTRLSIRANPRVGAVWFVGAMGLLDDAIREHLELKRLRGADPGDVAREEHAALSPMSLDQPPLMRLLPVIPRQQARRR